jgi:hypothetical protein
MNTRMLEWMLEWIEIDADPYAVRYAVFDNAEPAPDLLQPRMLVSRPNPALSGYGMLIALEAGIAVDRLVGCALNR